MSILKNLFGKKQKPEAVDAQVTLASEQKRLLVKSEIIKAELIETIVQFVSDKCWRETESSVTYAIGDNPNNHNIDVAGLKNAVRDIEKENEKILRNAFDNPNLWGKSGSYSTSFPGSRDHDEKNLLEDVWREIYKDIEKNFNPVARSNNVAFMPEIRVTFGKNDFHDNDSIRKTTEKYSQVCYECFSVSYEIGNLEIEARQAQAKKEWDKS